MGHPHLPQDVEQARERLRLLERVEDPATIGYLLQIGVDSSWTCLEVGAGRGSIAAWLSRRVGPSGRVVATEIDTRLLGDLESPNLEIRRHDVAKDDLEVRCYDLVHVRNVLVHVPEREEVLRKLTSALRPCGWILVEEPDVVTDTADPLVAPPLHDLYRRVVREIQVFAEEAGLDLSFGAEVFGLLRSLGFESLQAEGRARMFRGGAHELESPQRLAYADLREPLLATGRLAEQDFDDFLRLFDSPSFAWRESLRMSTWGRRSRI